MRCLLVLLAILASVSVASAEDVKVLIYSDYMDPTVISDFQKLTGITVKLELYEETEGMIAKLQAGGAAQYDLVVASDHSIPILTKLNLIKKLDMSKLQNVGNIDPRFIKPAYDPTGEYSTPYAWGTMGLFYNKKKLPNLEASWSAALDPTKMPDHVVLLDSMRDLLGASLKMNGSSVNSTDKEQLKKAAQQLISAKKSTKCLGFDGSPAGAKKVASGQADLAIVYNGDALTAMKDAKDAELEYVVPKEGSIIWVDTMVVTAKAPNPAGAYKLMDYLLAADTGAKLANFINYASPNAKAMSAIAADAKNNPRIYPTEEQRKTLEYLKDIGKATPMYDELWTAVKSR